MHPAIHTLVSLAISASVVAQSPLDVRKLTLPPGQAIAELDTGRRKGEPSRLAWSPDGSQLYLQTIEGWFPEPKAVHHYLISASGGKPSAAPAEPEWVSPYWTSKSHQSSPDVEGRKIGLESEAKREQTTSAPRGGDLARGGPTVATGASVDDATTAAYNSQMVTVHSMKLNGEIIGQFVNSVIVPGLTFGWGPKGTEVIAYSSHRGGRVVIMDADGTKREVPDSKDALLPAWSPDGSRLAWLEKDGRRKYALKVTTVR